MTEILHFPIRQMDDSRSAEPTLGDRTSNIAPAIPIMKSNPEPSRLRQDISGFQSQEFVLVQHNSLALKLMLRIAAIAQLPYLRKAT